MLANRPEASAPKHQIGHRVRQSGSQAVGRLAMSNMRKNIHGKTKGPLHQPEREREREREGEREGERERGEREREEGE